MSNLDNNDSKVSRLMRLRRLSHLLDNAIPIPGTNYRFGLDPLLGLIPGGGDTVTAFFSAYIVLEAALMGLPRETLMRMFFNIIFDTVVGSVPIMGDIFDVTWKANSRNVALLEEHFKLPRKNQKADKWFVFLLITGLLLFVMLITFLSVVGIRMVLHLLRGN